MLTMTIDNNAYTMIIDIIMTITKKNYRLGAYKLVIVKKTFNLLSLFYDEVA